MPSVSYPVLVWTLEDGSLLGSIIDTTYVLVAKNPAELLLAAKNTLAREMERNEFFSPIEMAEPVLRVQRVVLRPAYAVDGRVYPCVAEVPVAVSAVHGKIDTLHGECFLPLFHRRFYYFDEKQIPALIEQYTREFFDQAGPEKLHRYLLQGDTRLERVNVRYKERKPQSSRRRGAVSTQVLENLAERLPVNKPAKKRGKILPDAAWERAETVQEITVKLESEGVSVLVVGEKSAGKSAVLSEAMRKIHAHCEQEHSRIKTLWRTHSQRITADAKYLGDWQETCECLVDDLRRNAGLLWLEDFISLLSLGGHSVEDSVAAFFLPYVKSGDIQLVSELTPSEWAAARRLFPEFCQLFQIVNLEEMPETKLFRLMDQLNGHLDRSFSITVETQAMELAYRLQKRYIHYESFPGKLVQFISQLAGHAIMERRHRITNAEVIATFIDKTGLPEFLLLDRELLQQEQLHRFFANQVIGQYSAARTLVNIINVFKAGLNDPNKPVATALFAGPTGVGKTASARALAHYFFGRGQLKNPLVRIDMSEYQHPEQIHRLIGSGQDPGSLIKAVREHPFCVVLFDEIEKAHASIYDVLMNVLDEGLLVDNFGRQTFFRNCIVIMTTNLGGKQQTAIGFQPASDQDYHNEIRKFFRPEFYNRIDHLVVFQPLSKQIVRDIALKELRELNRREGLAHRNLELQWDDAVVDFICKKGFHPRYGARPLQRAIERYVTAVVSRFLLGNPSIRDTKLRLGMADGETVIIFTGPH